jgi:hypothetical protein
LQMINLMLKRMLMSQYAHPKKSSNCDWKVSRSIEIVRKCSSIISSQPSSIQLHGKSSNRHNFLHRQETELFSSQPARSSIVGHPYPHQEPSRASGVKRRLGNRF